MDQNNKPKAEKKWSKPNDKHGVKGDQLFKCVLIVYLCLGPNKGAAEGQTLEQKNEEDPVITDTAPPTSQGSYWVILESFFNRSQCEPDQLKVHHCVKKH